MYRNTRLRVAAALAAITCLLFSQLVMAAYACPAQSHSAAAAMASAAMDGGDSDDSGSAPCTEHDAGQHGLCAAHCNPADLSLNHAQIDTPPVMLIALHPLADQCEPAVVISTAPRLELPLRSHAPPISILHCCFRI